jgi:glutathione S-transferase
MIALHGSPISNYYNKVKMVLLEKGMAFEEVETKTESTDEAVLAVSPLAKIPFVKTEQGGLCESQAIVDWLEAIAPQPPLVPPDAFAAAKVRELCTFIDWHLEVTARQLYSSAFFGAPPMEARRAERIRADLEKKIAAFQRLARFSPYVAGETFTLADCSAFNNLPLVAMATKATYGTDLLAAAGVDHRAYVKFVGERASAQKVVADRKAAQARL